jgi:O-antigen/teichoic acid export membrane protein
MLGKNLISSVLTQIPVFILGVVSGVFSTRILGENGKGVFSLFQANTQLFVLVFSLGIQTGIVYFVSSKKIAENIVAGMTIQIFLISSSILFGLLILLHFTGLSDVILSEDYTSFIYLIILFILFAFTFINAVIASFFQAHSKFRIINLIAILNSVFNALIFAGLFLFFQSNEPTVEERFNYVLSTTLISLVLNSLLWLFFAKRELSLNPDFNFTIGNDLKKFISYNLLIYLGMFVNFFNYRLDLWIVNNYLDEKNLSYYSLAANINQIILYLAVTIASVMFPNFSSKGDSERNATFVKISRICFSFFIIITITAFLVSPFIIPFMYGEEFDKTVLPFQILMPGILFSSITQLFSIYIVSVNRNIFNIIACSAGLIFTVILDVTLIPRLGITGAAIATSISYFAIFFITYIFVVKQMGKITLNFFIPRKEDIRYVKQFLNQRS